MALRVDFYSLQSDGSEKVVGSYLQVGDHVETDNGHRVDEPYTTPDGELHDPNVDPDDYLENLYREYAGSYSWAGYAYEEDDGQLDRL